MIAINNNNLLHKYYCIQCNNIHITTLNISLEEKLRCERQRMQVSTNGISSHIWSNVGKLTLLPWKGNLQIAKDVMNNHYDNSVDVECAYDKLYSAKLNHWKLNTNEVSYLCCRISRSSMMQLSIIIMIKYCKKNRSIITHQIQKMQTPSRQ